MTRCDNFFLKYPKIWLKINLNNFLFPPHNPHVAPFTFLFVLVILIALIMVKKLTNLSGESNKIWEQNKTRQQDKLIKMKYK